MINKGAETMKAAVFMEPGKMEVHENGQGNTFF